MEESTMNALYTGTYVFVFIIALTVTIYLFNSITHFADVAFAFNNETADNASIVEVPVSQNRLLTGEEVISYYYNYVKKDLYGQDNTQGNTNETDTKKSVEYIVTIEGASAEIDNFDKVVNNAIKVDQKYILKFGNVKHATNGKSTVEIEINKATSDQINAML